MVFISLEPRLKVAHLIVYFDLDKYIIVEQPLNKGEPLKVLSKCELIKMKKASGRLKEKKLKD